MAACSLAATPLRRCVPRPSRLRAPARASPHRRPTQLTRAAAGGPEGGPSAGGDTRRTVLVGLASLGLFSTVKELIQDLGQGIDEEGNSMVRATAVAMARCSRWKRTH
jgi:hypothetical protein